MSGKEKVVAYKIHAEELMKYIFFFSNFTAAFLPRVVKAIFCTWKFLLDQTFFLFTSWQLPV